MTICTRIPSQWSPDGSCIAVWDGYLQHGVCLYTPDGEYLAKHSAGAGSLGVRTVAWAPSGQLLAVAGFDQVIACAVLGSNTSNCRTQGVSLLPSRSSTMHQLPGLILKILSEVTQRPGGS